MSVINKIKIYKLFSIKAKLLKIILDQLDFFRFLKWIVKSLSSLVFLRDHDVSSSFLVLIFYFRQNLFGGVAVSLCAILILKLFVYIT